MAYDQTLAARMRDLIGEEPGMTEKAMFGGLAFLLNGNMAAGVVGQDMVARVDKSLEAELLERPHARPMDFTGRPMKGWLFVGPEALLDDSGLQEWLDLSVGYARTLPPKQPKPRKKK